jgi:hypothetical protein
LDRAIATSTVTQMLRFITGPVTLLLIIRYLTPEEQGFMYSFAGVVGIQVFLEVGFAQSITQFTTKEFASLRFNSQGLLTGSPAALSRLRSIFHKANRYYSAMAAILALALAVGGYFFFSSKSNHGVPWAIPWFIISFCAGIGFLLTPVWAILEGCNRVAEVATYRFWTTILGFATTSLALTFKQGIYVSLWTALVGLVFPVLYLSFRWRCLILQFLRKPGKEQVSWRKDIWGFQWRIATIWGFKYLLFPATPALAFAISGPIIAGKIGLCYQLAFLGGVIGTTWTATKIPRWGSMITQGKIQQFKTEWEDSSKLHICAVFITQIGALLAIITINLLGLEFNNRFLSPLAFAGFALGIFFHSFWLIFSHYFRAKREEPLVKITAIAALTYILSVWLHRSHGACAITYSFALANLIGSSTAFLIWKIKK